ncbi:hypothetical protein FCX15_23940, partial [Escherichia coli]|nr:hypothetical protein [Escherichia coli]
FHTIVSIKNDGHYFCRAGGNRPDGLNEPVTGLLGSVALVTTSIPIPAGRPGRHMRHVPRPCNTVFTYSLSLSGKFFYPQPKCLPLLDIASQCPSLLPDMLINFALINITDRKNEGTNTIDGNWQADEGRRYRDNVRIYF